VLPSRSYVDQQGSTPDSDGRRMLGRVRQSRGSLGDRVTRKRFENDEELLTNETKAAGALLAVLGLGSPNSTDRALVQGINKFLDRGRGSSHGLHVS
jgi:hypothetical protein